MASTGKHVAYYRVSTPKQGRSGLGLEAQRHAVEGYLNGGDWQIVGEFTEIETGKRADRPALAKALAMCCLHGARLVIAKLDRLSRNAHFLLGLKESGVDFVAADMPNANRLTVGIMAMAAEDDAQRISQRTKDALAAAKRRGVKLGGDRGVIPNARSHKASAEALHARTAARPPIWPRSSKSYRRPGKRPCEPSQKDSTRKAFRHHAAMVNGPRRR
jgi:DNA invertase Pin-like site-specific DNA recombinase